MKFQLEISKQVRVGLKADVLQFLGKKVIGKLKPKWHNVTLSLAIVSNAEIKRINSERRGLNVITDVLSFSFLEDGMQANKVDSSINLGEIIIAKDRAKLQAKKQRHTIQLEIEILFIHGLLHILGYDHENDQGFREMLKLEKQFLGESGGVRPCSAGKVGLISRSEG